MTLTDQHSWKGTWWNCVWMATGRSGFDIVVVTVWMDTGSPPWYRTQTCQLLSTLNHTRSLSRNAGLLVSYTNYLIPPQTTSAANLKLHTDLSSNHDTPPVSTSVNLPTFHPRPSRTKNFASVSCILLLRKTSVIWSKYWILFRFISICLSDAHPRAGRCSRQS